MSIGETLAEERQRAGLSVTAVSHRTRIRETVIRAIEADDFTACRGAFYARGHIRGICSVIGIDPEPLIAEFDAEYGGVPQPASAVAAFEVDRPVVFKERRTPNWSAAMAVALVLVVIYGIVQLGGNGGEQRTARQVAGTPAPHPTPSAASPPTSPKQAPAADSPRRKVEIHLKAKRTTWLNVRDDKGRTLFSGTLRKGDEKDFTTRKKVKVTVGVGGSVRMNVNGEDIGAPGKSGSVHEATFDREDPRKQE